MILNDVGARWNGLVNDVSRGWPCNGKFTERQKLLYNCALATSDHMFQIIRPGMKMAEVDAEIRRYNYEQLKDAGVCEKWEDIGTYMWHGGAHHIGYDVHDMVKTPEIIAPGMAFCVDVGIYHEEWGHWLQGRRQLPGNGERLREPVKRHSADDRRYRRLHEKHISDGGRGISENPPSPINEREMRRSPVRRGPTWQPMLMVRGAAKSSRSGKQLVSSSRK